MNPACAGFFYHVFLYGVRPSCRLRRSTVPCHILLSSAGSIVFQSARFGYPSISATTVLKYCFGAGGFQQTIGFPFPFDQSKYGFCCFCHNSCNFSGFSSSTISHCVKSFCTLGVRSNLTGSTCRCACGTLCPTMPCSNSVMCAAPNSPQYSCSKHPSVWHTTARWPDVYFFESSDIAPKQEWCSFGKTNR